MMAELHLQPLPLPGDNSEQSTPMPMDLARLDFRQMMLKWQTTSQLWRWDPSSDAIAAMENLVNQIRMLRSPESGWDESIPQTIENLAPYVTEEASDLLDAIEAALDEEPVAKSFTGVSSGLLQQTCRLEEWIPQVLWAIARSQPTTMRLLEGTLTQVCQPGEDSFNSGVLRLVVILELSLQGQKAAWDLVTGLPPCDLLAPTATVEVQSIPQQASEVVAEGLLQQITTAAQQGLPELSDCFQGQTVELLWPGQGWQKGNVTLSLSLAFVPQMVSPSTVNAQNLLPASPLPQLHFTDVAWVEQYRRVAARSHLTQSLAGMAAVRAIAQANPPLATEEAIAHLINAALNWVVNFPQTTLFATKPPAEGVSQLQLEWLAGQLSWKLSQIAYPVMQMLGGVICYRLQPDLSWQTGILRLRPLLSLQTPETDWYFDLSHQQLLTADIVSLPSNTVVRSEQLAWCQQPALLSDLTTQLRHLIEQQSPELCLLQKGTEIDLLWDGIEPMPGALQLSLEFEFRESQW